MLPDISLVNIEQLYDDLFTQKGITVEVLRLDKIHVVVSGNKLFKLHYFLEEAMQYDHTTILSFGGAWSNHLVATAYAGKAAGLKTIGIVRGERPLQLSPTLQQCLEYGMQLKFVSRQEYSAKEDLSFTHSLQKEFGSFYLIPEGGYHPLGAKGAAGIMQLLVDKGYTHLCTATGTATTLAGLLMGAEPRQSIIGISVLKGMEDMEERMNYLNGDPINRNQLEIWDEYHFGGYAKKTAELIAFMNHCWEKFNLPLDIVYTAKMLYAVFDKAKQDHFPQGSRIICLHTGGLQGNRSLPVDTLLY